MSSWAAGLGYLPLAISVRRSKTRAMLLKPKMRAVASPISLVGCISWPDSMKWAAHRSSLGLKNLTNPPVDAEIDPTSLPLCRLQKAHAICQIAQHCLAAVLQADDVVHLAAQVGVSFVDQAILAEAPGSPRDQCPKLFGDVATCGQRIAVPVPSPIS